MGMRMDVERTWVAARWPEAGAWQTFTMENYGGRAIHFGDIVFLKAHTGKLLHVQNVSVLAEWNDYGTWQRFTIESKEDHTYGPVMPGDSIFLRAHTGRYVHVEGVAVMASWSEKGMWQALAVERSALRRLSDISERRVVVDDPKHNSNAVLV